VYTIQQCIMFSSLKIITSKCYWYIMRILRFCSSSWYSLPSLMHEFIFEPLVLYASRNSKELVLIHQPKMFTNALHIWIMNLNGLGMLGTEGMQLVKKKHFLHLCRIDLMASWKLLNFHFFLTSLQFYTCILNSGQI